MANFLPVDQNTTLTSTSSSTSTSTVSTSSTLSSTASAVTTSSSSATSTSSSAPTTTGSTQTTSSSIVTTTSVTSTTSLTTSVTSITSVTAISSQATTLTSTSSVSSTTIVTASSTDPVTVPSISLNPSSGSLGAIIDVSGTGFSTTDTACSISGRVVESQTCSISGGTLTATAFTVANVAGGSYYVKVTGTPSENSASAQITVSAASSMSGYSISFSPPYWFCTDSYVTFTGPLLESGYYGDTLQFQYYQYDPNLPSALNLIFTDAPLTVTSDSVSYWIHYPEYAPVNFAYMPYIAVRVVDITPKSNGNIPGQIFLQLTNISPESFQSCEVDSPISTPEFQLQWVVVMISLATGLLFVKTRFSSERRLRS